MGTKFTPGPWAVKKCPCGQPGCDTYQVIGVGVLYEGSGFPKDDAHLLAAARDLYKSLEEALAYVERTLAHQGPMSLSQIEDRLKEIRQNTVAIGSVHNSSDAGATFSLRAAREALAKARGEA